MAEDQDCVSASVEDASTHRTKHRRIAFAVDDNPYTFESLSWALAELVMKNDTLVLVHIVKAAERKDSQDSRYMLGPINMHMNASTRNMWPPCCTKYVFGAPDPLCAA